MVPVLTVPLPPPPVPAHVPSAKRKHPAESCIPFANVDVADVPVIFKYVDCNPAAKVDVAVVEVDTR